LTVLKFVRSSCRSPRIPAHSRGSSVIEKHPARGKVNERVHPTLHPDTKRVDRGICIRCRAIGKVSDAPISPPMEPAAYADVTLLGGPMLEQFRSQHATLLAMDEDALLKPFRLAAALSAPGEDLGGWYIVSRDFNPPADMHGFIPGHSFGQYVSSLARAYATQLPQATPRLSLVMSVGAARSSTKRLPESRGSCGGRMLTC
jgi:hypothetical protein